MTFDFSFGFTVAVFGVGLIASAALLHHDIRCRRLPDFWNGMLAVSGLMFAIATSNDAHVLLDIAGGLAVGPAIFLLTRWAFFRIRQVETLGLGDVKLIGAIGCWVGLTGLPMVIFVGALGTLSVIGIAAVFSRSPGSFDFSREYPFGPGLIVGLVAMLAYKWLPLATLWPT